MGLDQFVLRTIADHRTGWADFLAQGLMAAGQPAATYVGATVAALLFAWVLRAWGAVAAALVSSFVATVVAEAAKEVIGRPRPPADLALVATSGPAMPSSIGALTAGAAVPLVIWGMRRAGLAGRAVAALLVAGTVFVGVSMVYLGAHWLTDVVAGWALGAATGTAASWLFGRQVWRRGAAAALTRRPTRAE